MRGRRWRVTKGGWVILTILVVCAVLLTLAGGTVRFLAGAVGGFILLALVGGGLSGGWGSPNAEYRRKSEVLHDDRFGSMDDR
jgi:hypothetical protein